MKLRFCPAIAAIVFLSVPAVAHAQQWTSGSGGTIYYNGGNVGIGTTNPRTALHVFSNVTTEVTSETGNVNAYAVFRVKNDVDRAFQFAMGGSTSAFPNSMYIWDENANTARMYINASGNVGIGTTSPSGLLHIQNPSYSSNDIPMLYVYHAYQNEKYGRKLRGV